MKTTVIINGAGGVGKDTLCSVAAEKYSIMSVSSIDPIKEAARKLGWDDQKDLISRKFLSDLKALSIEYNNWPTKYLLNQYELFQKSDLDILFVHIREGNEIESFKNSISGNAVTLLIKRNLKVGHFGNDSDDDVENYSYDYVYDNNKPLEESRVEFLELLDIIIQKSKENQVSDRDTIVFDLELNGDSESGMNDESYKTLYMPSNDNSKLFSSDITAGITKKEYKKQNRQYAFIS